MIGLSLASNGFQTINVVTNIQCQSPCEEIIAQTITIALNRDILRERWFSAKLYVGPLDHNWMCERLATHQKALKDGSSSKL